MDNRHIRFCEGLTPTSPGEPTLADLQQLLHLFEAGSFWAQDRQLEDWGIALANSHPVISVWDQQQLIGFARATSDGIYRGTIWDVVIHPDYRGHGLGRKLVQTVLAHPHMSKVERVYLMTTHQQSFYERIGFTKNSSTTMVLHQQKVAPAVSPLALEISH